MPGRIRYRDGDSWTEHVAGGTLAPAVELGRASHDRDLPVRFSTSTDGSAGINNGLLNLRLNPEDCVKRSS